MSAGPLARCGPSALTVNGLVDPVGVDPDDCSFAWTLQASGRGGAQTAFRIVVRRTDPGHSGLAWDSGTVLSARQAFVAYAGPPLAADAAYEWTVQPRGDGGRWGPVSAPARFTTALRRGRLAGPVAAARRQFPATRPRHLPAHRGHTGGRAPSAARPPTSPPPTPTGCTSTGRRWTPGPASPTPTSSTRGPST